MIRRIKEGLLKLKRGKNKVTYLHYCNKFMDTLKKVDHLQGYYYTEKGITFHVEIGFQDDVKKAIFKQHPQLRNYDVNFVEQTTRPQYQSAIPSGGNIANLTGNTYALRKIQQGEALDHIDIEKGTITGCFTDVNNNCWLVTAGHVFMGVNSRSITLDKNLQVGFDEKRYTAVYPCYLETTVKGVIDVYDIRHREVARHKVDVAAVKLDRKYTNVFEGLKPPQKYDVLTQPIPKNIQVQKYGVATGLTHGKIFCTDYFLKEEENIYSNVIGIYCEDGTYFTERGDSGSLVTTVPRQVDSPVQAIGIHLFFQEKFEYGGNKIAASFCTSLCSSLMALNFYCGLDLRELAEHQMPK